MSFYEEYACASDLWCVKGFPLTLLQLQEGVRFDLPASFDKNNNNNNNKNNNNNNSSLYLSCTLLFSLYKKPGAVPELFWGSASDGRAAQSGF